VLEACCRSPVTIQRDLKRARIVLLAAAGRSTRSIAKEVGVQPRIVSLWRHRYVHLPDVDAVISRLRQQRDPGRLPLVELWGYIPVKRLARAGTQSGDGV
jgi:Homeodomain-like domain